jgi:hypothetical protein
VYLPEISTRLGIHLWLKLETANPTGTFNIAFDRTLTTTELEFVSLG